MVIGSEVPNLLQGKAASTLVVSKDVDIAVPVQCHAAIKTHLDRVTGLRASHDEPSVWVPDTPELIEANFVGLDRSILNVTDSYILQDSDLPLMVFGQLSLLEPAEPIAIEGLLVPVPQPAGLLLEKLISERSAIKGERDLLVVMGLLLTCSPVDLQQLRLRYGTLPAEMQHAICSNLSLLSLMEPLTDMPDPRPHRKQIAELLTQLEADRQHT